MSETLKQSKSITIKLQFWLLFIVLNGFVFLFLGIIGKSNTIDSFSILQRTIFIIIGISIIFEYILFLSYKSKNRKIILSYFLTGTYTLLGGVILIVKDKNYAFFSVILILSAFILFLIPYFKKL